MTIVVTERHGLLAIFSRNSAGELKQRAIIDSEEAESTHLELATFAEELSAHFHWNGTVAPPATAKRIERRVESAIPPPAAKPPKRRLPPNTRADGKRLIPRGVPARAVTPLFRAEILEWVDAHPDSSCSEISDGTNIGPIGVERIMRDFTREGLVTRTRYDRRSGYLYRTAEPPALDLSVDDEPVAEA